MMNKSTAVAADNQSASHMPQEFFSAVYFCLMLQDPAEKVSAVRQLYGRHEQLPRGPSLCAIRSLPVAGIPDKPRLVDPAKMQRRGTGSLEGRIALLHALAHIEFNAINLALDAAYRFRQMPMAFQHDWLSVANDEAIHFDMMAARLRELGSHYGALDAHDGLWSMACRTDHDVLVRMALVPRVLEARGLDVAPAMIDKLRHAGDEASADILTRIYHDEIGHVKIGNRWFLGLCKDRGLSATQVFADLLRQHGGNVLRGPYNTVARVQAGFSDEELEALVSIEQEFRHPPN